MKKSVALLVVISLIAVLLTSCKRYNKILYRRLSDPEWYDEFSMVVKGFEYWDDDAWEEREYTPDITLEESDQLFIVVCCDSRETFIDFYGGISDETTNEMINKDDIALMVCNENNNVLIKNGFYEEINIGDTITVWTTHFVYFDVTRIYMCGLKTQDKTYLEFDEGLSNIVKMMDEENQK